MENEYYNNEPEEKKTTSALSFLGPFRPHQGYSATPVIMWLNILVFAAMSISGVNVFFPNGEEVIPWGANFKPLTMHGEYWRMFTSMFVHFGIFHIAMNLYALMSVGVILEPFIGTFRFSLLYIISGLTGSIASLWWHNASTVSAGASGAVFGVYGIFFALLTTNLIDKQVRNQMLTSIGTFIGFNLLFGMQSGIDNAAHIGGLVGGAIGGYLIFFDLKNQYLSGRRTYKGLVAGMIIVSGLCSFLFVNIKEPVDAKKLFEAYFEKHDAIAAIQTEAKIIPGTPEYQKQVIDEWQKCIDISNELVDADLNENGKQLNMLMRLVAENRKKAAACRQQSVKENKPELLKEAEEADSRANANLEKLQEKIREMNGGE
ncbi:MAG: hypothetical protein Fur0041_18710 [Bacteroidia bacterium]